jgi:hypothetical protein
MDYFRQLLSTQGEERERLLSQRPAQREQFRVFIRAYESRPPEEREKRLQALELRLVITSLLRLQPGSRTQAVARLPESIRPLVKGRLDYWSQLAPDVQRILLENDRLLRIVTYVPPGNTAPPPPLPSASNLAAATNSTARQLEQLAAAVRGWNSLSEGKRVEAEAVVRDLFVTKPGQSPPRHPPLNPTELTQMKSSLNRFKQLPVVQQSQCIKNFSELAKLPPAERQAFLRSAEEWQRMTPEDREAWRGLIKRARLIPPLPPGMRTPPPPGGPRSIPSISVATNTNAY